MGSREEWFRSADWDEEVREHFEAKLARARPHSRAQYLRIKGLTLLETGDARRTKAGVELLLRVIAEYPRDLLEASGAHYALGNHYARAGRLEAAIAHLRSCLELESEATNISHDTELRLAEVLLQQARDESLPEAWALLERAGAQAGFHSLQFRVGLARARAMVLAGEPVRAAEHAQAALALLDLPPQLPRHPDVGVAKPDVTVLAEARAIASGSATAPHSQGRARTVARWLGNR